MNEDQWSVTVLAIAGLIWITMISIVALMVYSSNQMVLAGLQQCIVDGSQVWQRECQVRCLHED